MKWIIINNASKNDWYYGLIGKILPLKEEKDEFFVLYLNEETLLVSKEDASVLQKMEFDLDKDVLLNLELSAKRLNITIDELFNLLLRQFKNKSLYKDKKKD